MGKINKFLLAFVVLLSGCTKDFLDVNNDPNNPTSAPFNQLLTGVEQGVGQNLGYYYGFEDLTAIYMQQLSDRTELYGYTGNDARLNWSSMYTGPLQDIELIIKKGEAEDCKKYTGIAKILKAYCYSQLVDLFGDVPFSEANRLNTDLVRFPKFDDDQEIYPQLLNLLDEGIADLKDTESENLFVPGNDDIIYNGNTAKWVKAAKTIKLKLYNQIRLFQDVSTQVSALVAEGDLIGTGEDFQIPYGTSVSPDDRNPGFLEYESGQKSRYISPYYYEIMMGYNTDIFSGIVDPRVKYYFYNQLKPGQDTREGNPVEYRDGGFVSIYPGSVGVNRDHSTDKSMTVLGIYPVGGRYDSGDGIAVGRTSGTGAAPYRMITYADRLFIEAELAKVGLLTSDARTLYQNAVTAAVAKVDAVVAGAKLASQTVPVLIGSAGVTTFINNLMTAYDAADSDKQLEMILTQKWIHNFGSSINSWNDNRRTGYPVLFDPRLTVGEVQPPDPALDPIPVLRSNEIHISWPWPSDDLDLNPKAPKQKNPITYKVFWDN